MPARRPEPVGGRRVIPAPTGPTREGGDHNGPTTAAGASTAGETTVELTYLAQLGSWLVVQPDVQYVIHPGGTRGMRNAVVPGLRIAASH